MITRSEIDISFQGIKPIKGLKRPLRSHVIALLNHFQVMKPYTISLMLCSDPIIHELNQTHRKRDRPTDVLSFPTAQPEAFPVNMLGDIVISLETTRLQAEQNGLTPEKEFTRLLIHGLLHLLGHDHLITRDAHIMQKQEKSASSLLRTTALKPVIVGPVERRPILFKATSELSQAHSLRPELKLMTPRK